MDVILAAIDAALSEQQKKARAAQAPTPPGPVPPPVQPRVVAPQAAAPAPVRPAQVSPPVTEARPQPALLQGMFADGNSLLRAVIAAEVLGPPSAVKEHHFWNPQPNEPSI